TSGASQPGTDGEIIKVNGGSGEHGGFDIQNGKIVAIGTGVRVWGTVDKDGRNPSGKPIDQLSGIKIPDGVDAGSVLIPYNQTNANSNAPNVTDIFILNEYSGFYKDNNHWSSMDAFTGNRGTGNEPDYVFIDATPGKQYTASNYTNNRNGQTNTYENVNIQNVVKGPNHIEAVLDGEGGYWLPPAGNGTTSIEIVSEIGFQEYEVEVIDRLHDTDGSEELISEIKLSGLPEGAVVMLDGVKLSSQDGVFVIAN